MTVAFLTLIAVLLRIFSNPLANVFQKQLSGTGNHPLLINFLTYLLLSLVCVPLVLGINFSDFPVDFWLYSLLGGVTGALGNGFLVKALQKGDLSVLGPINSYKSVIGMLVALFLLKEIPNVWGVLGVGLIIYGSYFVLDSTEERFTGALLKKREIRYRIAATILSAIEAVFLKKVILASSATLAFVSWCWFGALFSFILILVYRLEIITEIKRVSKQNIPIYFYLIVCIGTMQFTTNFVFEHMPVGYALSLFQLSALVSVFLGHKIFNELDIRKKMIGTAIMVIGSLLIILMK